MTNARTLQLINLLPMPGWLSLAVALFVPSIRSWVWPLAGIALPCVAAVAYAALLFLRRDPTRGSFFTFEGLQSLFTSPKVLLAGWTHFVAFDLFVGAWIARVGTAGDLPSLLLLALLALTLMLGPLGFLAAVVCFAIAGVPMT